MSGENINTANVQPAVLTTTPGSNTSAGTLPNGDNYGNSIGNLALNSVGNGVVLGGGNLYMLPVANLTAIPDDATIETVDNVVGIVSGGFKITSKPKLEEIYNQFNDLVGKYVIKESFTVKTGIVSWNQSNIAMVSTGTGYATQSDYRTVWTPNASALPIVLVRFTKNNPDGTVLRFTMVGQGGKGFDLNFADKPVSLDAELDAIQYFNNFIAEIRVDQGTSNVAISSGMI